ncbi:orotate phosphoribosyltransferase [Xenorhabdus griffiniae]|uniref:orotate phosphoribosyltransferase n=1 Tax=Xenorhabdus griffiniae TaxID=351672 RepID=UPI0023587EBE|nr:orotate phosphoribosyltransferase [Xenorhabdus griffiniae]MDC9607152.1 orotate phosphoribosyltransferase [Xenorhabdus griffiniae]
MSDAQNEFASFLIDSNVVEFGNFRLKSGRHSPYFFNFGKLSNARLLNKAAWFYARFISENNLSPDVIFGPAYKGIPLGVAIALSLQRDFHTEVNYSFNRKEIKNYGDGGIMVGATLQQKRVLTVDDVITSGMTIDDTIKLIRAESGLPVAYLVALDRQERGADGTHSALQSAASRLDIDIYSITTVGHIISCLRSSPAAQDKVVEIENYLEKFGVE